MIAGNKFIKLSLYIISILLAFLLFILFVFSSNNSQIEYKIPQKIGGTLSLKGIEIDYYEFCEYDVFFSYQLDNSDTNYDVGSIWGVIEDITICDKMGLYIKQSIYSDLQITHGQGQYKLAFNDGFNPQQTFISNNLKYWYSNNIQVASLRKISRCAPNFLVCQALYL
jgi:hypothetical protein